MNTVIKVSQEKEYVKSQILNALHAYNPTKSFWVASINSLGQKCWSVTGDRITDAQFKCGIKVPQELCIQPDRRTKMSRFSPTQKALEPYMLAMQSASITQSLIKDGIKSIADNIPILQTTCKDGRVAFFTGNCKGTARYQKKQASKVQDKIKALATIEGETFALTITYDIKKYGENMYKAWKMYSKHIRNVLENMRKHWGLRFVWVKESTTKGYPHAHIVLHFPKGTNPGYKYMQNNKKIYFGKLYNEVKSRVDSRVFELRAIKGNRLQWYLTKYISKFDENDLTALSKQESELDDAQIKYAQELLATKVTRTRTVGFSKFEVTEPTPQSAPCADCVNAISSCANTLIKDLFNYRADTVKKVERLRSYLIKLCTNSPFLCAKPIFSMKKVEYDRLFMKPIGEIDEKNPISLRKFQNNARRMSCSGCFFSQFVDYFLGQDTFLFKKTPVCDNTFFDLCLDYLENLANGGVSAERIATTDNYKELPKAQISYEVIKQNLSIALAKGDKKEIRKCEIQMKKTVIYPSAYPNTTKDYMSNFN